MRGGVATRSVLALTMPSVRIESGSLPLQDSPRAAIIASFGTSQIVSLSLTQLVAQLKLAGYSVVLVRASDNPTPLEWDPSALLPDIVIRKPNIGYDFGSLAVGIAMVPEILGRAHVLLVNDSLLGPFAPLTGLISDFESSTADVWGACQTLQVIPHLQSFFIGFHGGVLQDPSLKSFWSSIKHETDKSRIIADYEIGLSRLLYSESFSSSAAYDSERLVHSTENPTIAGWKRLIELGMPFVKRELYLHPELAVDGNLIRSHVIEMFGTDPEEWL